MTDLNLFFPISQRILPWQPILWQNRKLPSFVAVAFHNGMEYHYTNMPCKNFVNFGKVTPELIGLICELLVRHGKNNPADYLRICWTDFHNLFTV